MSVTAIVAEALHGMIAAGYIIGWTLVSYALGCINGAYYLHRIRTGSDIRLAGSGNAGARNAARMLGWRAFALVFLVDAGKGVLAVLGAQALGLGDTGVLLAVIAVVLGHVYPVQLGFRGGKGIATTLGAMLVADPLVALAACGGALLFLLVLRRPALAGSLGVAALPVVGAAMDRSGPMFQGLFALTVLITVAHKNEINDYIRSWNRNEPGG